MTVLATRVDPRPSKRAWSWSSSNPSPSDKELAAFVLVQPALDVSYTLGLLQGIWYLARGDGGDPIG